jgi:diguanylate cyclase (GGDEF)-like protein
MELSLEQQNHEFQERIFNLFDSLSLIKALSEIEIASSSEEEVIQVLLTALLHYQRVDSCSVFKVQDDRLHCVSGMNLKELHEKLLQAGCDQQTAGRSMWFSVDEGILGRAVQSGELQYCPDCSKNKDFKQHCRDAEQMPGSLVCVPVKMGGSVLGVLNASHPNADFFEPWQLQTLTLVGNCLGQIFHNHHLIHRLEYEVEQRTRDLRIALEESEMLKRRYQQLSTEDELTGLHNRRYFFTEAEAMVSRALRYGYSCSLMLLDVDYFKQINDRYGHATGDRVLCLIADVLKQEARGGDLVARVGGEEFVIILPDAGPEGADLMAQRIHARLGDLELGGEVGSIGVTVCIGISCLRQRELLGETPGKVLDRLYSEADRAMYECKSEGRNCRKLFVGGPEAS